MAEVTQPILELPIYSDQGSMKVMIKFQVEITFKLAWHERLNTPDLLQCDDTIMDNTTWPNTKPELKSCEIR